MPAGLDEHSMFMPPTYKVWPVAISRQLILYFLRHISCLDCPLHNSTPGCFSPAMWTTAFLSATDTSHGHNTQAKASTRDITRDTTMWHTDLFTLLTLAISNCFWVTRVSSLCTTQYTWFQISNSCHGTKASLTGLGSYTPLHHLSR